MIRRTRQDHRGFTLTEVVVTITIIAALGALAFPVIRSGVRSSQEAACLSNLRSIGLGLEAYLQDSNQRMPVLEAGRRSRSEDIPVIDTLLEPYLRNPEVFHCPADDEQFAASGSSYLWNTTQNGRHRSQLVFFGNDGDLPRIPLVIDKEAWHPGTTGSNFLYADLSATDKVRFDVLP